MAAVYFRLVKIKKSPANQIDAGDFFIAPIVILAYIVFIKANPPTHDESPLQQL